MATWKRLLTEGDISTFTPTGTDYSGLNGGTALVTEDLVHDLVQAELDAAAAGTTNTVKITADNASVSATDATASFKFQGASGGPVTTSIASGNTSDPDGIVSIGVDFATATTVGVASFLSNHMNVSGTGGVKLNNTITYGTGGFELVTSSEVHDITLNSNRSINLSFDDGDALTFQESGTTVAIWEYDDAKLLLSPGGTATQRFKFSNTGNLEVHNDLIVGGDLTVNGDTTTINTAQLTVDDPLLVIGDQSLTSAQYDALSSGGFGGIKLCTGTENSTPHFAEFVHDHDETQLTGWKVRKSAATFANNTYGAANGAANTGNVMVMDFVLEQTPDASDNAHGIGSIVAVSEEQGGAFEFYIRTL